MRSPRSVAELTSNAKVKLRVVQARYGSCATEPAGAPGRRCILGSFNASLDDSAYDPDRTSRSISSAYFERVASISCRTC